MRSSLACTLLFALLAGCQAAPPRRDYAVPHRGSEPLERLAFWGELADQPVAGNDDALHALLLFLDQADPHPDYPSRVAALKQRGLLPADFDAPAGAPARRGTVAFALASALKLKGGVTMRLLGPSPRYALRELEFRGLFPPSSPNQTLSGNELVGVISKAEDYRATGSADVSAVAAGPAEHTRPVGPVGPVADASPPQPPAWLESVVATDHLSLTHPILASMAQDPAATGPAATGPAAALPDGPFTAVVELLEGAAQWKPREDADWALLKQGDTLTQDATVETAERARVVLRLPGGQSLVIYHLTEVTLIEVQKRGGTIKTDIGLKHGRTEYEIFGAGVRYDSKVRAPNTTLAVRSTRVLLYEQPPFTSEAVSLIGRADFYRKGRGDAVALGRAAGGKARVRADRDSAADTALDESVVDPTFPAARTTSERALIANLVSRGAVLGFDPVANINVLTGGDPFKTTPDIARALPGQLTFVLTWDQPAGAARNSNVDLLVANRSGDLLFPVGAFSNSPNGGRVPFDHRGGARGGIEYAYFTGVSPQDLFYVTALPGAGTVATTDVTLRAFLNGLPLQIGRGLPIRSQPEYEFPGTVGPDRGDVTSGFVIPTENFVDDDFDPSAAPAALTRGAAAKARRKPTAAKPAPAKPAAVAPAAAKAPARRK